MKNEFSFIILTYNEEIHLPRLLESIKDLNAPTFVMDSGSTDSTVDICQRYGVQTASQKFINHPSQWDAALKAFAVETPWIIGLDADQSLDEGLKSQLKLFNDHNYQGVNGIYFRRKYFFKGTWVRFGGYYPFYQLKMFRTGIGYSDLNENMDHRFVAPGRTLVWKTGNLIEENFKENSISFWIQKHNRYSDLIAQEEVERMQMLRQQVVRAKIFGAPDEQRAFLKQIWWKLPRYLRPFLYFSYRMIFQLGLFDRRNARIFHFLHAFWFRLMVDVKIEELLKSKKKSPDA